MLLGVGKKTPCITRFSTTAGERGSADASRDPRGFACKLYTDEGNWDWVWNNVPFFFIRDPLKFPSLVHSQKRNPQTNLRDANKFWEWVLHNPESLHMVMWLFSEYGTAGSFRHMNGYQGHAHKWTMPDGSFKYVHMYLQSDAGYKFNTNEDVTTLSGASPDHATEDLYNAIEKGDYPTWTAIVQVVDPTDIDKYGFNIFDMTKHWDMGTYPKDLGTIPGRPFGKLTLQRNPENYFAEIEQVAFSPSHLVPGIEPTADPLLQARLFAYPDAHRHRLGVNYQSIPVNRPSYSYNPLYRDGAALLSGSHGKTLGYRTSQQPVAHCDKNTWLQHSDQERRMISGAFFDLNDNDIIYPRTFWTHLAEDPEKYPQWQEKLVVSVAKNLYTAKKDIREACFGMFTLIDSDLGNRVQRETTSLIDRAKC
jgi:catalase